MGNEANCTVRLGKQKSTGKALLETSEILFRGDFRLKIPFASIKSIKAADGELRVEFADEKRAQAGVPFEAQGKPVLLKAIFELGEAAEKWCHKVLHPKTRIEKLGVKPGDKISLVGEFDVEFLGELKAIKQATERDEKREAAETIFLGVTSREELARLTKLARSMKGAAALWIVYPKGQKTITENDVLVGGRKAGLKDVKVVGFSTTHTALKFVLPLESR